MSEQDNPYQSPNPADNKGVGSAGKKRRGGIKGSIAGALVLLTLDAVMHGTFLTSILVCPVWFLVSVLKNAIQRPGWILTTVRIAIPVITLAIVLVNDTIQREIAWANAPKVIGACRQFQAANGRYPENLDELVPQYLPSIPCAKHCLVFGEFRYWNLEGRPMLVWYSIPPFGREIYHFDEDRWSFLD
ncbi:MAG: hypothetical protein JW818_15705 [Pirellulales bacterium]|nr:hypothetical protein [Pirellulales bacterium]